MMKHLRIAVLLLGAVLFGTVQAACACAPYQQSGSEAHHQAGEHGDAHSAHAQHQPQSAEASEEHHTATPSDCGDGEPCDFHAVHQLTADTLTPSALTAPAKPIALATLAMEPRIETPSLSMASGFPILSRAPPRRPTPVTLKVRLQN